ncbi:MAG: DUF1674 domain-containing protein [Pseudomonadota bacterium]
MNDDQTPPAAKPITKPFDELPPAAQRALKEAEARRAALDAAQSASPKEIDGRGGKDPARYGDWEVKGLAVDF